MIKKSRAILKEFRESARIIKSQNAELIWANIFHDTIKDKDWLMGLSISPGRWAGGYSMLYIIVRVLTDYRPNKIIEFGLGESSKIISAFIENHLKSSIHDILEQDENWIKIFNIKHSLSERSDIKNFPLIQKEVNGFKVNSYSGIEKIIEKYDLYIVDGPFGSPRYSRFDIFRLTEKMENNDEFIILIDDYNRPGEKDTVLELMNHFKKKNITVYTSIYAGEKAQFIIATEKYRFITSA